MFGLQCQKIFTHIGKQFNSIVELQTSVILSWDNINQDYVRIIYKSMYKRLLEVINRKGQMTKY